MAIQQKHQHSAEDAHHEEVKSRRQPRPPKYQPNLTPVINVMFTFLLFFLVATKPKSEEGNIPASLPEIGGPAAAAGPMEKPRTQVQVTVRQAGTNGEEATYEFGGATLIVNPDELYQRLAERAKTGTDDVTIQIVIGPQVRWAWAVEAFNQAAKAGFKQIGFAPTGG